MTQAEAIARIKDHMEHHRIGKYPHIMLAEALDMALSALRPVRREQVEKVWRGEWEHTHSSDNSWTEVWKCSHCDFEDNYGECFDFCPFCGAAQTDEAVQMMMERLEALTDVKTD